MFPPRGRHFFANPGPTNIPDSILLATAHASVDFNDPAFFAVYEAGRAGLRRVLRQEGGELFFYTASGHGAWDATLVNLFSPGDRLLMIASGYFSDAWAAMAARLGLVVETIAADPRRGAEIAAIEKALRADTKGTIRAVCAVHNETSTGLCLPLPAIRAAIDAARHPALFLVDTISSLGSFDFRMSEWGVDAAVGGSQKGLMLPAGMSFTAVSERAMAAHREAGLTRGYFDWTVMLGRPHKSFMGTVPVTFFYGLRESLRLIEEEGLENVFARHHRLAGAVRAAVRAWSGNHGPALYCLNPERLSDSVTTILMPDGFDAEAVRTIARERFNVSLGGGLGALGGKVFRIGHLGDLNEAMVMGTLAAVELSLQRAAIPHGTGALDAAVAALAV
ncbi:alanine--glyoxylate aminotransferase family protein [Acidiphilium sp.]|uniref:pyridoxal-phosphate-dependent aminotransferase family protein n=1 Tax=Acidiphilium sp. TaxID=527 RepID=UPI00258CAE43|nr:aminotransferase class V-fold PLP-dependent enzyme [Acidiphilium sp.]